MTTETSSLAYLYSTREDWMEAFTLGAREYFASLGFTIPENLRVSVSSPSINSNKRSNKGKVLGECWHPDASGDGHYEIFIVADPHNSTSQELAGVLTHELCHAATGNNGHGKRFGEIARKVGLEGQLTATYPGEAWGAWALPLLAALGPMPYSSIDYGKPPKPKRKPSAPQGFTCHDCDAQAWLTKKNRERFAYVSCINPDCDGVMLPKEEDTEE